MSYQIASHSEKGRQHATHGDQCTHGWFYDDKRRKYTFFALSDGLDERDFFIAMNAFSSIGIFAKKQGLELDKTLLATALQESMKVVDQKTEMVGFSGMVWYEEEDEAAVGNMGNTSIYKHSIQKGLLPLVMEDGGELSNLSAGTIKLLPGESLVACSDGLYSSTTFKEEVEALLDEFDLNEAIKRVAITGDDDRSIAVIRRDFLETMEVSPQEMLVYFKALWARFPTKVMGEKVCKALESMLDTDLDSREFAELVSLMKAYNVHPSKEHIDRAFTKAVNKLNSMPEGEEKQKFNMVCTELKEILRFVFTH